MNVEPTQLLHVADAVARDKGIDREEVIEAMEQAIQKAGRIKYGHEHDIRAYIDRKTGEIDLMRCREVVEEVEDELCQISPEEAQKIDTSLKIGDLIKDKLPPIDFGRIAAQTARQVIVQRVREAERQRQYQEYKDRVGEVINGLVKRVEFGNVIVDLGRAEGWMRRDDIIPRENHRVGDRVRAYIYEVREEARGPQIFLSRTHPDFMAKLFAQEVPEIYDGIIEIKSVARDPGSRAKIAVYTADNSVDPVGACVGMRGSRVQAVVGELQGEKVDIVPWSASIATFVVNALAPAEVSKVIIEEEENRIQVDIPDDQLSLAIGRRGQNVRLATKLTGWEIEICGESEASEKRSVDVRKRSALFTEALDVDEVIAHLLVAEGFSSVEEISTVSLEDFLSIEGFEEELASELQTRAKNYLEENRKKFEGQHKKLGLKEDLLTFTVLSPEMLVALGEKGVKTLDDFADLATDEVVEILTPFGVSADKASKLIMAARAHWFEEEDAAAEAEKSASEEAAPQVNEKADD